MAEEGGEGGEGGGEERQLIDLWLASPQVKTDLFIGCHVKGNFFNPSISKRVAPCFIACLRAIGSQSHC